MSSKANKRPKPSRRGSQRQLHEAEEARRTRRSGGGINLLSPVDEQPEEPDPDVDAGTVSHLGYHGRRAAAAAEHSDEQSEEQHSQDEKQEQSDSQEEQQEEHAASAEESEHHESGSDEQQEEESKPHGGRPRRTPLLPERLRESTQAAHKASATLRISTRHSAKGSKASNDSESSASAPPDPSASAAVSTRATKTTPNKKKTTKSPPAKPAAAAAADSNANATASNSKNQQQQARTQTSQTSPDDSGSSAAPSGQDDDDDAGKDKRPKQSPVPLPPAHLRKTLEGFICYFDTGKRIVRDHVDAEHPDDGFRDWREFRIHLSEVAYLLRTELKDHRKDSLIFVKNGYRTLKQFIDRYGRDNPNLDNYMARLDSIGSRAKYLSVHREEFRQHYRREAIAKGKSAEEFDRTNPQDKSVECWHLDQDYQLSLDHYSPIRNYENDPEFVYPPDDSKSSNRREEKEREEKKHSDEEEEVVNMNWEADLAEPASSSQTKTPTTSLSKTPIADDIKAYAKRTSQDRPRKKKATAAVRDHYEFAKAMLKLPSDDPRRLGYERIPGGGFTSAKTRLKRIRDAYSFSKKKAGDKKSSYKRHKKHISNDTWHFVYDHEEPKLLWSDYASDDPDRDQRLLRYTYEYDDDAGYSAPEYPTSQQTLHSSIKNAKQPSDINLGDLTVMPGATTSDNSGKRQHPFKRRTINGKIQPLWAVRGEPLDDGTITYTRVPAIIPTGTMEWQPPPGYYCRPNGDTHRRYPSYRVIRYSKKPGPGGRGGHNYNSGSDDSEVDNLNDGNGTSSDHTSSSSSSDSSSTSESDESETESKRKKSSASDDRSTKRIVPSNPRGLSKIKSKKVKFDPMQAEFSKSYSSSSSSSSKPRRNTQQKSSTPPDDDDDDEGEDVTSDNEDSSDRDEEDEDEEEKHNEEDSDSDSSGKRKKKKEKGSTKVKKEKKTKGGGKTKEKFKPEHFAKALGDTIAKALSNNGNNGNHQTSSSARKTLSTRPKTFDPDQVTPEEHYRAVAESVQLNGLDVDQWPALLISTLPEGYEKEQVRTVRPIPKETPLAYWERVAQMFLFQYRTDSSTISEYRNRFSNIKKAVTENLMGFIKRFELCFKQCRFDHTNDTEDLKRRIFTQALEDDVRRTMNISGATIHTMNWVAFIGFIKTQYANRDRDSANRHAMIAARKQQAIQQVEEQYGSQDFPDSSSRSKNKRKGKNGDRSRSSSPEHRLNDLSAFDTPTADMDHLTKHSRKKQKEHHGRNRGHDKKSDGQHSHERKQESPSSSNDRKTSSITHPRTFGVYNGPAHRFDPTKGTSLRNSAITQGGIKQENQPGAAAAGGNNTWNQQEGRQRQEGTQRDFKRESSGKPTFGPCTSCKGPHDWDYCPRNQEGKRPSLRARGLTGPNPYYTQSPATGTNNTKLGNSNRTSAIRVAMNSSTSTKRPTIVVPVRVNNQLLPALLDTGAEFSSLQESHYLSMKPLPALDTTIVISHQFQDFAGRRIFPIGRCTIPISITDPITNRTFTKETQLTVMPGDLAQPVILSMDDINHCIVALNTVDKRPVWQPLSTPDGMQPTIEGKHENFHRPSLW